MVFGKNVEVTVLDEDRYGRSVGIVRVDGRTVNQALLENGFAWLYTKYCDQSFCGQWKEMEKLALSKQIGLWADKSPTPPWDYRKNKREGQQLNPGAAAILPEGSGGVYHGNVKSHVFHSPDCQHFNCKNCIETFRSIEEAVKAGFHKHEQCVKG